MLARACILFLSSQILSSDEPYDLSNAIITFDVPVQLVHSLAAGTPVEVVNVLRNDGKSTEVLFHFRERVVSGIGLNRCNHLFAVPIPFPHKFRVMNKRVKTC